MRRFSPTLAGVAATLALAAPAAYGAVTLQVVDTEYEERYNADGSVNFNRYNAIAPFDIDADGRPDIVSTGQARGASDFRYSRTTPSGVPNLEPAASRLSCGSCAPDAVDGLTSAVVNGAHFLAAFDPDSTVIDFFDRNEGTLDNDDQLVLASNVESVAIGDVNGDGVPDLVVLLENGDVDAIPGELTGSPPRVDYDAADAVAVGDVAGTPVTLRLADVAGDSLQDVVVLTNGASADDERIRVATATGTSPPAFSGFQSFATPPDPLDFELADFDGDGRRDVLLGTQTGVTVARNETATGGAVMGVQSTRSFNVIRNVAAGDVDGDGRPEILAGPGSTLGVAFLEVQGTSVQPPETFDTVNGVETIIATDLDGDGADEVVAAGIGIDVLTNVSPGSITAAPNPAALGSVEVGRTGAPVAIALTNAREGTERVRGVRVEGANPFDVLVTDSCGAFMPPGGGCGLTARLSPSAVGARSAQIRVDLLHAPDLLIPVTGEGTAPVPGPAGPQGPPGESVRTAVLTRIGCARPRRTRVRCTLRLAAPTDVAAEVRMLIGGRSVGRKNLAEGATRVSVNGKVPARRRSVTLELRQPDVAAQRVKVRVPRGRR